MKLFIIGAALAAIVATSAHAEEGIPPQFRKELEERTGQWIAALQIIDTCDEWFDISKVRQALEFAASSGYLNGPAMWRKELGPFIKHKIENYEAMKRVSREGFCRRAKSFLDDAASPMPAK
jgi:hypothetical protein